ncbi:hypothetical protein A3Q56_07219 [Intoshia linei]|uniref:Uncharacterized protein n=1 Tax=Intoshia linei TaxID=1819745 RepID=A0A177AST9_9BILA|nr:hypothetical protein A3Q56_07219 [Intoshia linei]
MNIALLFKACCHFFNLSFLDPYKVFNIIGDNLKYTFPLFFFHFLPRQLFTLIIDLKSLIMIKRSDLVHIFKLLGFTGVVFSLEYVRRQWVWKSDIQLNDYMNKSEMYKRKLPEGKHHWKY